MTNTTGRNSGKSAPAKPNGPKVVPLQTQASSIAVTNGQRAMWTFLGATLVAPFLAAVVIMIASLISGFVIGRGPASLLALDPAGKLAWSALKAVETYVWCAMPAALSGAVAAAVVYTTGALPWLAAASIAAIVASATALLAGGMLAAHITPIAFIAATVGIGLQWLLRKARILA